MLRVYLPTVISHSIRCFYVMYARFYMYNYPIYYVPLPPPTAWLSFPESADASKACESSLSLEQVLAGGLESYDAVYLPGGHGVVYDAPTDAQMKQVLETMWAAGKVVSAVCHGPAGLVSACRPDGKSIVEGKAVSGFTNAEEIAVQKQDHVPFMLEDKLKELGGKYECGPDWAPYAVK
jgi:hypothetical protein